MSQILTPGQIYQLALKHGFSPQEAVMVTAIAGQESQGNTGAFNPKDSHGGSVGLMQINGANAGLIGGADWKTVGQDPDANMAAAHALYVRRGNFNDWGGYTDGGYKKYYNQALAASGTPTATTLTSVPASITHPHTLTPPTAGAPYTPEAVAAANPPPAAPSFGESIAKGDVGGAIKAAITKPKTKDAQGNEVEGKSPLEKLAGTFSSGKSDAAPVVPEMHMPVAAAADPMAGMAPAAQQLFSSVSAAAAKPLSWSSTPYGAGAGQIPGMTLNQTGYGYG